MVENIEVSTTGDHGTIVAGSLVTKTDSNSYHHKINGVGCVEVETKANFAL